MATTHPELRSESITPNLTSAFEHLSIVSDNITAGRYIGPFRALDDIPAELRPFRNAPLGIVPKSIQIHQSSGSFNISPTHLANPSMMALTRKNFAFNIKASIISPSCFAYLARPLSFGRLTLQRHFAPFQCIEPIGGCKHALVNLRHVVDDFVYAALPP